MGFRFDTRHLLYPVFIFMRLGKDKISGLDGIETIKRYEDFCQTHNEVWFSTDSLSSGMSKKRRNEFVSAINNGQIVEIYFAIGKSGNGNNDIYRKATVIDIETAPKGMESPDQSLTPDSWKNSRKKIWIKIRNISKTDLTKQDFIVQSTKNVLGKSIHKSEYHFGYIEKKV